MQILALSRRVDGVTPAQLAPLAAAEAAAAYRLLATGTLRSAHMCPERPGAMLVLECATLAEAQAELATLPMVAQGLLAFDVCRMLPYTGTSALFSPEYVGLAKSGLAS
jgi:hypothetical protein